MKPVAAPGFDQDKIQLVANHWGVVGVYPAVSADLERVATGTYGGSINTYNIEMEGEELLYSKVDPEFASMAAALEVDPEEEREVKAKTDAVLTAYKAQDAGAGAVMQGMVALAGVTEALAKDVKEIIDMAWSPDSTKLAAIVYSQFTEGLIVYVIDASDLSKKVMRGFYSPVPAKGSDDDSKDVIYSAGVSWRSNTELIYSYFKGKEYELIRRDLETGEETVLSRNKIIRAYYSPDGNRVAYYVPAGGTEVGMLSAFTSFENQFQTMNLWVADSSFENAKLVDKGDFTRITHPRNLRVGWSEDGRRLTFAHDVEHNWGNPQHVLYVYEVETGEKHQICTGPMLNTPNFSPDGQEVYFYIGLSPYRAILATK
jgi:hypothetical protein